MKFKTNVFALAAMLMALSLTGCYTQVVKKEPNPEYSESTTDEREYREDDGDYREYDRVTNIYVYDDFYYRRYYWERWDPWYAWHYRYPRSGWYVRLGYYDYDYWDWTCGTRWGGYYDPWWDRYAYAGWGPRWGWYDPYWDHYSNVPRGRGHVNEKRPFGRRSSSNDDGSGGVARRGSDRGHLSKPEGTTYARGDDGIYRRTRRTDTESIRDTRTEGSGSSSDGRRSARRSVSSDTRSDAPVSLPNTGGSSVARPARSRDNPTEASKPSSDRRSSKRESSDNEKVSRRSSSNDSGSSSSGSSASSPRRSSNSGNSSGSSSSGVSRSGNSSSGSSSKGSSSSGSSSSSNNNSSSGSNRRSRN